MNNIAIFVSGTGTNAINIISYFKESKSVKIKAIFSNKNECLAIKKCKKLGISTHCFTPNELRETSLVDTLLASENIDFIILAGFLLLMPKRITEKYNNRIINIHPALLPAYGGKGMYGDNVHKAVVEAKESESGMTIHLVNSKFDEGKILFQAKCSLDSDETYQSLAKKVHNLEIEHFPSIIEEYIDEFVSK